MIRAPYALICFALHCIAKNDVYIVRMANMHCAYWHWHTTVHRAIVNAYFYNRLWTSESNGLCILFKLYFALNWNWNGLTIWPKIFWTYCAHIISLYSYTKRHLKRKKNESFYFKQQQQQQIDEEWKKKHFVYFHDFPIPTKWTNKRLTVKCHLKKQNKTNEWRRNKEKLKCITFYSFTKRKAFAIYFSSRLIHLSMNLITDFVLLPLLLLLLLLLFLLDVA